jgi:hypothetical protein
MSTKKPSEEKIANVPPFGLRMLPELKERIAKAAAENSRSMNAEIVARLEESISSTYDADTDIKLKLPEGVKGQLSFNALVYDQTLEEYLFDIIQQKLGYMQDYMSASDEMDELRSEIFRREEEIKSSRELVSGFREINDYLRSVSKDAIENNASTIQLLCSLCGRLLSAGSAVPDDLRDFATHFLRSAAAGNEGFQVDTSALEEKLKQLRGRTGNWDWENSQADPPPPIPKTKDFSASAKEKKSKKS